MNAVTHFEPKDTAILFDADRNRIPAGLQQVADRPDTMTYVRQVSSRSGAGQRLR